MEAKQIATLVSIARLSSLRGELDHDEHTALTASLWKLAADLGVREQVNDFLETCEGAPDA